MSEYQRIAFRAIDAPLTDDNLEYMRQQSSRAEITAWSFDNEYQYGDFRGDASEMLRRGYDFHLHYANFGIRKLLIRLPHGFPDPDSAQPYLGKEELEYEKDKKGTGGILVINPYYDSNELEEFWEFDELIDHLARLRAEILDGDLRPLYLAHLAVACDDNHMPEETTEAPVPAGLECLTHAQRALAEFYGLGETLIAAAAQDSPRLDARADPQIEFVEWLQGVPSASKNTWVAEWMANPKTQLRAEILAEFRQKRGGSTWATVSKHRSVAELFHSAEAIQLERNRTATAKAVADRAKMLERMAKDPNKTIGETEKLVKQRRTEGYRQIAVLLADLREAMEKTSQPGLAVEQAKKLVVSNPTLRLLKSELRRHGLLSK